MNRNTFSQRFNQEIAAMGLPTEISEKTKAVAKVFNVTRHLANALLFGHILPSEEKINHIAQILEVCPSWLSGATNKRKAYSESSRENACERSMSL